MERCPICRATFKGEAHCRRCGAELSTLLRIEQEAAGLAQRAIQLWARGEVSAAAEAAKASLGLQDTRLARVLCSLAREDQ